MSLTANSVKVRFTYMNITGKSEFIKNSKFLFSEENTSEDHHSFLPLIWFYFSFIIWFAIWICAMQLLHKKCFDFEKPKKLTKSAENNDTLPISKRTIIIEEILVSNLPNESMCNVTFDDETAY